MKELNTNQDKELVVFSEKIGVPATTSLIVAEVLGKVHKNVLSDIRTLIEKLLKVDEDKTNELTFQPVKTNESTFQPVKFKQSNEFKQSDEFKQSNEFKQYDNHGLIISLSNYIDNKNEERPMYILNQSALTLLLNNYTGDEAFKFKLNIVDAFDKTRKLMRDRYVESTNLKSDKMVQEYVLSHCGLQLSDSHINRCMYVLSGGASSKRYDPSVGEDVYTASEILIKVNEELCRRGVTQLDVYLTSTQKLESMLIDYGVLQTINNYRRGKLYLTTFGRNNYGVYRYGKSLKSGYKSINKALPDPKIRYRLSTVRLLVKLILEEKELNGRVFR